MNENVIYVTYSEWKSPQYHNQPFKKRGMKWALSPKKWRAKEKMIQFVTNENENGCGIFSHIKVGTSSSLSIIVYQ